MTGIAFLPLSPGFFNKIQAFEMELDHVAGLPVEADLSVFGLGDRHISKSCIHAFKNGVKAYFAATWFRNGKTKKDVRTETVRTSSTKQQGIRH